MSPDESVQSRTGTLRYNDAGSNGRWQRNAPCQKALEIDQLIAPSIVDFLTQRIAQNLSRIYETDY